MAYETELVPTAVGFWTYRLFLDGEKVTAFPIGMKMYATREQALKAATRDARAHHEMSKPRRVPIDLF